MKVYRIEDSLNLNFDDKIFLTLEIALVWVKKKLMELEIDEPLETLLENGKIKYEAFDLLEEYPSVRSERR